MPTLVTTLTPTATARQIQIDMPECGNCGGHVSTNFARVFGDRDDSVERCYSCTTKAELRIGRSAFPERQFRIENPTKYRSRDDRTAAHMTRIRSARGEADD